jgi:hypothetical protein
LAFHEIIIGPNQDVVKARDELTELLKTSGYVPDALEYPTITESKLSSWPLIETDDGTLSTGHNQASSVGKE